MKIHAWTAIGPEQELVRQEFESAVGANDVAIDVLSCSLTRGDVRFIDNYWGNSAYPLVTGYEVIGRVRDSGHAATGLKAGDVVGLGYQVGACFTCEYCKAGKEQYCLQQKLIPFSAKGGLADVIVADSRFAFRMPKKLQRPEATPLMCAGLTVFAPISHAALPPRSKVAVIGLGGLGHFAVQFLAAMGHDVTVFTHSEHKIAAAKKLGASSVILDGQAVPARSFDFIIYCATADVDWAAYIQGLKPEGTLCIVGLPPKPVSFAAELLADFSSRRVVGNYVGSRQDMQDMLAFAARHEIISDAKIYPMDAVNQALGDMRANKIDFGTVLTQQ